MTAQEGVSTALLSCQDLAVEYSGFRAVQSASLHVEMGEVVSLLGPNGAGKSSLLRALVGLVRPSTGTIHCAGEDATAWSTAKFVAAGVVLVPEGRHLFGEMTVLENLQTGAGSRQNAFGDRLDQVYELFPVLRERKHQEAATLSGGEQQMLAIARGLMADPKLLILDEPSLGLAPIIVETILEALARLRGQGLSMLVVEQDVHVAVSVADRCYLLELGSTVLEGRADEFVADERVKNSYLGTVGTVGG